MAPLVPYHVSAGSNPLVKFGGMHETEFIEPPPGRAFCLRQRYRWKIPPELERAPDSTASRLHETLNHPSGPPTHFHPFQNEWFRVVSGRMCVEMDGQLRTLTPEDGEIWGRAGSIHRFYIAPDSTEDLVAVISASDCGRDYQLDRVFFENWYGMWHDYLVHEGGKMDMIQILCVSNSVFHILSTHFLLKRDEQTYDAGDIYFPGPAFLPPTLQRFTGYWTGVIVGRWLGGLLGYRPFFKEYTTDWDFAVAKMQQSVFTRRLVDTTYKVAQPMAELNTRNVAWKHGGKTDHLIRTEGEVNGLSKGKDKRT
ncbi:hypothetical protein BJ170DRAFT_475741 [Xylariales sp. AK1849]|nr:hypothetical protein BJ170DRAFT_475741 [Xylariales sp. AK1849]